MAAISDDEFDALLTALPTSRCTWRRATHAARAVELPYLAKWRVGEPDGIECLQGWCAVLRDAVGAGKTVRRLRVVSEPGFRAAADLHESRPGRDSQLTRADGGLTIRTPHKEAGINVLEEDASAALHRFSESFSDYQRWSYSIAHPMVDAGEDIR